MSSTFSIGSVPFTQQSLSIRTDLEHESDPTKISQIAQAQLSPLLPETHKQWTLDDLITNPIYRSKGSGLRMQSPLPDEEGSSSEDRPLSTNSSSSSEFHSDSPSESTPSSARSRKRKADNELKEDLSLEGHKKPSNKNSRHALFYLGECLELFPGDWSKISEISGLSEKDCKECANQTIPNAGKQYIYELKTTTSLSWNEIAYRFNKKFHKECTLDKISSLFGSFSARKKLPSWNSRNMSKEKAAILNAALKEKATKESMTKSSNHEVDFSFDRPKSAKKRKSKNHINRGSAKVRKIGAVRNLTSQAESSGNPLNSSISSARSSSLSLPSLDFSFVSDPDPASGNQSELFSPSIAFTPPSSSTVSAVNLTPPLPFGGPALPSSSPFPDFNSSLHQLDIESSSLLTEEILQGISSDLRSSLSSSDLLSSSDAPDGSHPPETEDGLIYLN